MSRGVNEERMRSECETCCAEEEDESGGKGLAAAAEGERG